MRVRVVHDIDDLANDMLDIAKRAPKDMVAVVREGVKVGTVVARDNAKASSGVHGKNYFKRITGESHGLIGEFGPHGDVTKAVGAGWRNGPGNHDLARAADLIGPSFAQEVRALPSKWFWT